MKKYILKPIFLREQPLHPYFIYGEFKKNIEEESEIVFPFEPPKKLVKLIAKSHQKYVNGLIEKYKFKIDTYQFIEVIANDKKDLEYKILYELSCSNEN